MAENIDLKVIEKNILKSAHQHGFFDMFIGFVVTGMAFGPFFRESLPSPHKYFLWPLILVIIADLLLFIIIKYVIQPRTGIAKPGPSLKSMRKKLFIVTFIQFVIHLTFVILLVIGIGRGIHVEGMMFILMIGLFFIPIFAIIAYLMKYPRLYFIGMLIWLAIFINELLYDPIDYRIRWLLSYGIIGGIIFFIGLVIFIKFLKKYPLKKEEVS
ncbi:MAG: hypothetical protein CEE43_04890 [Promethearchaeota archaeon Loki_b32]|nr:MAG: hypothetical protein CEE43_04890 [Candidatus Lokiarchaeota archaeon Loki_b32]